jgi:hypothetical protein
MLGPLMSKLWRSVIALVLGGLVAGCEVIPATLFGGELIVFDVANHSGRPATLVVAESGDVSKIVGSVDPAIVPAHTTVKVRFTVPPTGQWAIWANGGELMGRFDLEGRRGNVPFGIDIGEDSSPSWWCRADCP